MIRRRAGQSILIGDEIKIEIVEAGPGRVKLGITAPKHVLVLREEIALTRDQNRIAAQGVSREAVWKLANQLRPAEAGGARQEADDRQQSGGA